VLLTQQSFALCECTERQLINNSFLLLLYSLLLPSSLWILNSKGRAGGVKITKPVPEYAGYIGIVQTLNPWKPNWEVKCSI